VRKGGRLHEDVDRLLEGAAGERALLPPVDAVSRDGHQCACVRHRVAQNCQVPVVDVRPVELDHGTQLTQQGGAHGLDAQPLEDLHDVIGGSAPVVNLWAVVHDAHERRALRVQHPLGGGLVAALGVERVCLRLAKEHPFDVLHPPECHVLQRL